MSIVNLFQIINIIISISICLYILIDLIIKKRKLKSGKIEEINTTKYSILIVLLCVLFTIYGFARNFK